MNAYLLSDNGEIKRFNFSNRNSDTANGYVKDGKTYIWGRGEKGFDFYPSAQNINFIK